MICDNIRLVRKRIEGACQRAGRDPKDVTLLSVTKEAGLNDIIEAIRSGITDIGENRVKEALIKYNSLRQEKIRWHMIGHLQGNKARDALKIFDVIHSVDSPKLADEINKEGARLNRLIEILIEVNVSSEKTKFGIKPDKALGLAEEIASMPNVRLSGLMAMAPMADNSEYSRPYYRELKKIFDDINSKMPALKLKHLSMGMTQDFEVAIEEGATMVRVGRAIFVKN